MKKTALTSAIISVLLLISGCSPIGAHAPHVVCSAAPPVGTSSSAEHKHSTPHSTILRLRALAQSGKVVNTPYVAGKSTITQVKQQWGQPDTQQAAGQGIYATHNHKQAAFGFNSAGTIFDVRSYDQQIQGLTATDVKNALGAPNTITHLTNQTNDIYQVNQTYQLEFIINTQTNKVDHISVFDEQAVQPPHSVTSAVSMPIRGVIEGFYGTPWTEQEQLDMFKFMKSVHLNTYVYAPKGDPYQRTEWGVLYPSAKAAQMKTLVTKAAADGVQFVYSISPGIPASSTNQMIDQSITYSSTADRQRLEHKIDQMEALGVHTFMLSFDDIETILKPADQAVYGNNYAKAQMLLVNQVFEDESKKHENFQLWMAPTSYYGLVDGPYWQMLRSTLDARVQVIWTGNWVISKTITSAQAEEITQLLGRKPILWDNYPVNDYTYTGRRSHDLLMGPLQGRDATLLNHLSGYISNPMLQPAASKLALMTIADYLQHPGSYQPLTAWNEAIKEMPGITDPSLFKKFVEYTSASELNPSGYAPIDSLISAYENASSSYKPAAEKKLQAELQTLAKLPAILPPTITDKELLKEIQPWLVKLGEEGQGGIDALNEMDHPSQANAEALKQMVAKVNASPYGIGDDIVTFMKGAEQQK